jgi:hypothetical protein
MNVKRFVAACFAVFLLGQVLSFLINGVILAPAYHATQSVWRPEAELMSKMWIFHVTGLLSSVLFTYLFVKVYQRKGIKEGLKLGALIGLLMAIPNSYDMYAVLPIPYHMALQWFLFGTIQWMLMGTLAAIVYRPKSAA